MRSRKLSEINGWPNNMDNSYLKTPARGRIVSLKLRPTL
jgi:hypothetical protein